MIRRLTAAALAVIFVGALASCARGSTGSGVSPGGGSAPSASATGSATPGAGDITLRGQVDKGVEPGCLILKSGGKTYELMTEDHSVVHAGAQVVVTGHVATGMMSHCMQGAIFLVTSARQG